MTILYIKDDKPFGSGRVSVPLHQIKHGNNFQVSHLLTITITSPQGSVLYMFRQKSPVKC